MLLQKLPYCNDISDVITGTTPGPGGNGHVWASSTERSRTGLTATGDTEGQATAGGTGVHSDIKLWRLSYMEMGKRHSGTGERRYRVIKADAMQADKKVTKRHLSVKDRAERIKLSEEAIRDKGPMTAEGFIRYFRSNA
jgi:hypothetical protein